MSSIIKGGRIRTQGVINLSEHTFDKSSPKENEDDTLLENQNKVVDEVKVDEALAKLEKQLQEKEMQAQEKIEHMLNEALERAAQIEQVAKDKQTEIISQSYEEKEALLKACKLEVEQIKEAALIEKQQMLEAVEGEVVETLISLLEHIISEEIDYESNWLTLIVRKMLQKADVGEQVTLVISPVLHEKYLDKEPELLKSLSKLSEVKIDETMNDTTCKLITEQGNIEYDISKGLEKVISNLRVMKDLS